LQDEYPDRRKIHFSRSPRQFHLEKMVTGRVHLVILQIRDLSGVANRITDVPLILAGMGTQSATISYVVRCNRNGQPSQIVIKQSANPRRNGPGRKCMPRKESHKTATPTTKGQSRDATCRDPFINLPGYFTSPSNASAMNQYF
jgi:hypothetical protein